MGDLEGAEADPNEVTRTCMYTVASWERARVRVNLEIHPSFSNAIMMSSADCSISSRN